MAYDRAIVRLSAKGMGYINKIAADQFGLYSGLHVNFFVNHNNQVVVVKNDVNGFSLVWATAGLKFKARSLAFGLNLAETQTYTIIGVMDAVVFPALAEKCRVCKTCNRKKILDLFKEVSPGYYLWECLECYKKQLKENRKQFNLTNYGTTRKPGTGRLRSRTKEVFVS